MWTCLQFLVRVGPLGEEAHRSISPSRREGCIKPTRRWPREPSEGRNVSDQWRFWPALWMCAEGSALRSTAARAFDTKEYRAGDGCGKVNWHSQVCEDTRLALDRRLPDTHIDDRIGVVFQRINANLHGRDLHFCFPPGFFVTKPQGQVLL